MDGLRQLVWSRGALASLQDEAMVQRVALLEDNLVLSTRIQARLRGHKTDPGENDTIGPNSVAMLWMKELGRGVLNEEDSASAGDAEQQAAVDNRNGEAQVREAGSVAKLASELASASPPPSLLQACPWYTNGNAYCESSHLFYARSRHGWSLAFRTHRSLAQGTTRKTVLRISTESLVVSDLFRPPI